MTTTTSATAPASPFSAYEWYTENSSRLDAELVSESGTSASTVSWALLGLICNDQLPRRGDLSIADFEVEFKMVACAAARERRAMELKSEAEEDAIEAAENEELARPRRGPKRKRNRCPMRI